jgi:sugar transferase (PEP-CTERM/EpsH1 system associated)
MEPLLYLVHRIPFPPNKGDKVRSYNLLRFLSSRYQVHLGSFVDDSEDLRHVPQLAEYYTSSRLVSVRPEFARLRSLAGLWTGEPLTLRYYRDASLAKWVEEVVLREGITKAVVFSSAMAQYVAGVGKLHVVVDFVDVDSAKWEQYSHSRRWPLAPIYGREGRRLLGFERRVAARTEASVFVTKAEADLFRRLAPECASRVHEVRNGVDTAFFAPSPDLPCPYGPEEEAIVFTGAMDYWPNVDAVSWFVRDVLPEIGAVRPRARFYIVGMHPAAPVVALARDPRVTVTGLVPDVRPYLHHARVVVAPLRVARGIQNKVLEAMAMARPVVVSAAAAEGLSGVPGMDFEVAGDARDFAGKTIALMGQTESSALGALARARILADHDWTTNLMPFATLLDAVASPGSGTGKCTPGTRQRKATAA